MTERKYIYPPQKSAAQLRKEAAERHEAMLEAANTREQKRREAARPKCHMPGWSESNQKSADRFT
jgi:hypothetical protein